MIATRGFVRSSRARLLRFPTYAEVLGVGRLQIRLVLICVLVCRGYRISCLDCSSFDLRILLESHRLNVGHRLWGAYVSSSSQSQGKSRLSLQHLIKRSID
jgi:hypothetical protein